MNIIAGISNNNDLFYTFNKGKTNSNTFLLFITKVCNYLSSVNLKWRDNTLFMIDNAGYHRSTYTIENLKQLQVPVFFLGPY